MEESIDNVDSEAIRNMIVKCCACCKKINHRDISCVKRHPHLKVVICSPCAQFYGEGNFSQDEEVDKYCRMCAQAGHLYSCKFCSNAFCARCLRHNFGAWGISNAKSTNWKCCACDPSQLERKVDFCNMIINFAKSYKKSNHDFLTNELDHLNSETCQPSIWLPSAFDNVVSISKSYTKKIEQLRMHSTSGKSTKQIVNKLSQVLDDYRANLKKIRAKVNEKYSMYINDKLSTSRDSAVLNRNKDITATNSAKSADSAPSSSFHNKKLSKTFAKSKTGLVRNDSDQENVSLNNQLPTVTNESDVVEPVSSSDSEPKKQKQKSATGKEKTGKLASQYFTPQETISKDQYKGDLKLKSEAVVAIETLPDVLVNQLHLYEAALNTSAEENEITKLREKIKTLYSSIKVHKKQPRSPEDDSAKSSTKPKKSKGHNASVIDSSASDIILFSSDDDKDKENTPKSRLVSEVENVECGVHSKFPEKPGKHREQCSKKHLSDSGSSSDSSVSAAKKKGKKQQNKKSVTSESSSSDNTSSDEFQKSDKKKREKANQKTQKKKGVKKKDISSDTESESSGESSWCPDSDSAHSKKSKRKRLKRRVKRTEESSDEEESNGFLEKTGKDKKKHVKDDSGSSSDSSVTVSKRKAKKQQNKHGSSSSDSTSSDEFLPNNKRSYETLRRTKQPRKSKRFSDATRRTQRGRMSDGKEKEMIKQKKKGEKRKDVSSNTESESLGESSWCPDDNGSDHSKKVRKKKTPQKKKHRAKVSDESSDEEKTDVSENMPGKRRKKIRKIISDEQLADSTREAQEAEKQRRKRIAERQKLSQSTSEKE